MKSEKALRSIIRRQQEYIDLLEGMQLQTDRYQDQLQDVYQECLYDVAEAVNERQYKEAALLTRFNLYHMIHDQKTGNREPYEVTDSMIFAGRTAEALQRKRKGEDA